MAFGVGIRYKNGNLLARGDAKESDVLVSYICIFVHEIWGRACEVAAVPQLLNYLPR